MLRGGLVGDEFRRRPLVALTAWTGVVCIIVALVLPFIWTDSFPFRPLSVSITLAGAGVLAAGLCGSSFLARGTRRREFTLIGSGMLGMAMLVIGALTLLETNTPV